MLKRCAGAAVVSLCLATPAAAQEPARSGEAAAGGDERALAAEKGAELERDLVESELPDLAPSGDPKRIEQIWKLARELTLRGASCRATKHLALLEELEGGAIAENRGFAAQAFFKCSRVRLSQGFVQQSDDALQHAINIVGERPEFKDMLFKLAIVRAKEAVDRADLEQIRDNLMQARQLGRATGPGAGDRLEDWAIPIIHEAANEVAVWSRDLLTAGDRPMADEASALALEIHPRNRIAQGVRRDIFMYTRVLPAGVAVIAIGAILTVVLAIVRRRKLRKVALEGELDDV